MCQDDVAQLCSQAKVAQQLAGRSQEAASGRGCTDTQVCPLATGPALQAKEKTGVGYWGRGWGLGMGTGVCVQGLDLEGYISSRRTLIPCLAGFPLSPCTVTST